MDSNGEQEDQTSRRIRENKAVDCPICCEERPIIANLCCGQGACTTCFERCLIENKSCPFCRAAMTLLPTSSQVRSPVHDRSFRTFRRRRISHFRSNNDDTFSISNSISLATPPINRRISGNNNNMTNLSGSSNFPDSISFVTPTRSMNTPRQRMPRYGNDYNVMDILSSISPATTSSSRTRCSFPFWKYLRRIWRNHGNVSDFVSPQEVGRYPLFLAEENFNDIYASSDDEYSSSNVAIENISFVNTIVSPAFARTEGEMINRHYLGREDFSSEDDDISYDDISYENTSEDDISYIGRRLFRSSNISFQTERITDPFNNRSSYIRRYCRKDCGRDIKYPFH